MAREACDEEGLLVRGRQEEVFEVLEVHVDGTERDAGPVGDPARGGPDVAVCDEVEEGPNHCLAGSLGPC